MLIVTYAQCCVLKFMQNVITPSVILVSVMAPHDHHHHYETENIDQQNLSKILFNFWEEYFAIYHCKLVCPNKHITILIDTASVISKWRSKL